LNLQSCLPVELQGPSTTITKVAAGLSGAGVYRVDANGASYALKISDLTEPIERWRSKRDIQQLASDAELAPRIVHVDEGLRATLSEFVVDRSFRAQFMHPATREAALVMLATTLRRVHDLPVPSTATYTDPRTLLGEVTAGMGTDFVVPPFVAEAVRWGVTQEPPPPDHPEVLSHNDVNPSNLVYDGNRLLLLDWEVAGRNDRYYDLAAIAVFMRMGGETCRRFLKLHDGVPIATLPERFLYVRRLVATLLGSVFMRLPGGAVRAGLTGVETVESVLSLADFYQAMRVGKVNLASTEGQIAFALTLIKESLTL
jgi:aminoglycoside phosphotransferase (APT) family kinase protein